MIRNYLTKIDETHINVDNWYLTYVGTPKYCMSNAAIDEKEQQQQKKRWVGHMILNASHIGFTIMNASCMILHYQIQFCNHFNQFKKVDITIMI